MSKAFIKSRYIESIENPLSSAIVHESITFKSCKTVERPLINPNCWLLNMSFALTCSAMWTLMHPSRILHITQVRVTGLQLPAFLRFPFLLYIAETFACFQSSGNCLSVNYLLNNLCNGLHIICSHCSWRILGCIPPGPTRFVISD